MFKIRQLLASVKLVPRKSTALTKLVVAAAVVFSMAALLMLRGSIDATTERTEALRTQAMALEQENSRLRQYIGELGTVQGVIRIAQ